MIISHEHKAYKKIREHAGGNAFNGAYYYSKEIVRNIIPNVQTDRNWITIAIPGVYCDHAIVFVHNNITTKAYDQLVTCDDLILVCGVESTCKKVAHLGKPIYLPLSIDVAEVMGYKTEKTKRLAFAGRANKKTLLTDNFKFPDGTDFLEDLPRPLLLKELAKYRQVFAVGRTALEAKVLGCQVLPYDRRFPDPSIWEVVDNFQAAKILQKKLNEVDHEDTKKDQRV